MKKIVLIIFCLCSFYSCASDKTMTIRDNSNKIEHIIEEQIEKEEGKKVETVESDEMDIPLEEEKNEIELEEENFVLPTGEAMDLTEMNPNMLYSTLYQMVLSPQDYVGKKIKIRGVYTEVDYEGTIYYYIVIKDEMACCAQGIEFVCEDTSEFISDKSMIEVEGIFETYYVEEDDFLYSRLVHTTVQLLDN